MKVYHVYRHYGQYTDRYGTEEYGYYLSKPVAEKVRYNGDHEKNARGYMEVEEIDVDES